MRTQINRTQNVQNEISKASTRSSGVVFMSCLASCQVQKPSTIAIGIACATKSATFNELRFHFSVDSMVRAFQRWTSNLQSHAAISTATPCVKPPLAHRTKSCISPAPKFCVCDVGWIVFEGRLASFLFTHRPRVRSLAAGRSVSSLIQGAAHAGRCVQLAGLWAVGFSLHGLSVLAALTQINADLSLIQGVGL